jgi:GTPase Era involved in 16S rRNA processing
LKFFLGKSSVGNTLLGHKQFVAKAAAAAVTRYCQVGYRNFNNRHLVIVDTPGFFDNRDNDKRTTCIKIGQSLQTTVPGPHAFLIVLGFGRITDEVERGWTWITDIFGERALKYCIIVFTGLDNLNEDGETVGQFLENRIPSLARLMGKCGERYVAFNNRASVEEKNEKIQQLLDLVDLVIRNNENQVFTNNEIEAISKVVQEETKKSTFVPNLPDGSIILLPQTEKIVVEAYMRKPAVRRDMHNS